MAAACSENFLVSALVANFLCTYGSGGDAWPSDFLGALDSGDAPEAMGSTTRTVPRSSAARKQLHCASSNFSCAAK